MATDRRRRAVLAICLALLALGSAGCKRHRRVHVQKTDEELPSLMSVLHVADPRANAQLLSGFHGVEQNAWRWTEQRFSVLLRPPRHADQKGGRLQLNFTIPDVVIRKLKTVSLSATANGQPLAPETYTQPGQFTYSRDVPAQVLAGETAKVEFALNKAVPPGDLDRRELGVIVLSVGFDAKQ